MNSFKAFGLLSLLSLIIPAQAWWSTSHMLVARIAEYKLASETPEVLERAEGALSHLAEFTTMEKNHPFVECATFADNIKSKGFDYTSTYHYVDNPFEDGYSDPEFYPDDNNATTILVWICLMLLGKDEVGLEERQSSQPKA